MNKYTGIAGQMRTLSAEYRTSGTSKVRRVSIRGQLRLFHRRITAMWAASGALLVSLLSFLVTVLTLVFVHHSVHSLMAGTISIIVGLSFVFIAVILELWEIGMARLTIAGELDDIFGQGEETP
jgi:hypothetical protein